MKREIIILKERIDIEEEMCIFDHMDYIHNLYSDHAQLAQIGSQILIIGNK